MKRWIAALCIAVAALAAYVVLRGPLHAQTHTRGDWLPFTAGEAVILIADLPEGRIPCTVTQVQHGFIGCARENRADTWYNLQAVKEIRRRDR